MLRELLHKLFFWNRAPEPATKALGRRGEDEAAAHLKRQGFRIIARNVQVPMGEADIVAHAPDGRAVVIVEVKSRLRTPGQSARSAATPPEAAITQRKRRKLLSIARHLAASNGWHDRPVRIDVVAVEFTHGSPTPTLRHHVGI